MDVLAVDTIERFDLSIACFTVSRLFFKIYYIVLFLFGFFFYFFYFYPLIFLMRLNYTRLEIIFIFGGEIGQFTTLINCKILCGTTKNLKQQQRSTMVLTQRSILFLQKILYSKTAEIIDNKRKGNHGRRRRQHQHQQQCISLRDRGISRRRRRRIVITRAGNSKAKIAQLDEIICYQRLERGRML